MDTPHPRPRTKADEKWILDQAVELALTIQDTRRHQLERDGHVFDSVLDMVMMQAPAAVDGWHFTYDPETRNVGGEHSDGSKISVCEIVAPGHWADRLGQLLAETLDRNAPRWPA